jgi:serine/threonine protein kinase
MTIKLCDFGMADYLSRSKLYLQGVFGTAPFMSPEMLAGLPYGCDTDIWSLGVVANVLLLGAFPYRPAVDTSKAMKAAILLGQPEPTFRGPPGLVTTPDALNLLQSLLCRDPMLRPNAEEVLKLPWLQANNPRLANVPSLKKVFRLAQCTGAFDMRPIAEASPSNMECRLASLQDNHHPGSLVRAESNHCTGTERLASTVAEDAGSCRRRCNLSKGYLLPGRAEEDLEIMRLVSPGGESLASQLSTVATLEPPSPTSTLDSSFKRFTSKTSCESLQSQFSTSAATPDFGSSRSATGPNSDSRRDSKDSIVHEKI